MVGLSEGESSVTQRIGILGGTFDPPHIGHLVLAEYAAEALAFERVLFVPAATPPHKLHETRTSIEHRVGMLTLAIASNPRFALSRVDIDRPGPHYTVDMIAILQSQYPDAELYFVMGGDSLRDLPKWNRPAELIRCCKLVVLQRPNMEPISPFMHEDILPGLAERVLILDDPLLGFSSTGIVARLHSGRSIRYMTPDPVLAYIHEHQLYRKPE
ncbi:MAG: nicotinate-nucleotide adenylyltransferase [bacterium]|nr:nicotinate-nucleotide adenylyltransferase [bacterium]